MNRNILFYKTKPIKLISFLIFGFTILINSKLVAFNFQERSADSIVLENAFVRVVKNGSVKTSEGSDLFGKRVIVALSELTYKERENIKTLQRGEIVVFLPSEPTNIKKGEYFEIAIKKNHPNPKGPERWLDAIKNKTVYEDNLFRVFEERLDSGDTRKLHSHSQRLVVRLNYVQLTDPRFKPNGTPGKGLQIPNTVKFAQPMVHVVKNLSTDTPFLI
jgi:hypothetical protein